MQKKAGTFHIHDAGIHAWTEQKDDWASYREIRKTLREAAFVFHDDPRIRNNYPTLKQSRHAGSRRDLHFASEIYPAGFRFEFYGDVVRDNRHGGRYHFDKLEKMPYLRRQMAILVLRKISARLKELGFQDATKPVPEDSMEFVRNERADLEAFQGAGFYKRPLEAYNAEDADGILLKDGDVRYFRTRNGRLLRGTAWHHINNMWWVVVNRRHVENIASFRLFAYDAARHGRKVHPEGRQRIKAALKRASENEDFERAIRIRDALRRAGAEGALSAAGR